jgi:hypothetical protein
MKRNGALRLVNGRPNSADHRSNGFIRKVAVRASCDQPSSGALATLIDRLSDRAPPIRELAAESLNHSLSPSRVQVLLFMLEPLMGLAVLSLNLNVALLWGPFAALHGLGDNDCFGSLRTSVVRRGSFEPGVSLVLPLES